MPPTINFCTRYKIKIIEDYIELESLRYDDRLTVNFEKNIENVQSEIAPLILLPFVENAFKHLSIGGTALAWTLTWETKRRLTEVPS